MQDAYLLLIVAPGSGLVDLDRSFDCSIYLAT